MRGSSINTLISECSLYGAKFLALVSLLLALWWSLDSDTDAKFLGGVNFSDYLFQWHPILMTLGFVVLFTFAILAHRSDFIGSHSNKYIHAWLNFLNIVVTTFGLIAVVSYNYSAGFANLYSLHSMLGLTAMLLLFVNFAFGLMYYCQSSSSSSIGSVSSSGSSSTALLMPGSRMVHILHRLVGFSAFAIGIMAYETGIMEMNTWLYCAYYVTNPDNDPAATYYKLPTGCKVSNALGVVVFVGAVLTFYALFTSPSREKVEKMESAAHGEDKPLLSSVAA